MAAILLDPEVERKPEGACAAAWVTKDVKDAANRMEKRVNQAKGELFEKVEDGRIAAERLITKGRYAAEDGFEEVVHRMKREPFKYLAIAFAAGAFFGFMMPRFGRRPTS